MWQVKLFCLYIYYIFIFIIRSWYWYIDVLIYYLKLIFKFQTSIISHCFLLFNLVKYTLHRISVWTIRGNKFYSDFWYSGLCNAQKDYDSVLLDLDSVAAGKRNTTCWNVTGRKYRTRKITKCTCIESVIVSQTESWPLSKASALVIYPLCSMSHISLIFEETVSSQILHRFFIYHTRLNNYQTSNWSYFELILLLL